MSIESGAELPRVTVAKAIEVARNIISDTQDENRFPSTLNVYTRDVTDNGDVNPYPDGRKYRTELVKGKDKALDLLRASFLRFCAQTGTKPRNMHDVWNDDSYTGTAFNEDYEHDISASEMAIWIARFKTATDLPIMQEKAMSTPATEAQAAPAKAGTAEPGLQHWKMKIQEEAAKRIVRGRKNGSSPTVSSIKDEMAKWCRDNDVKTDGKIFPSAEYIRVHVLGAKHWKAPV